MAQRTLLRMARFLVEHFDGNTDAAIKEMMVRLSNGSPDVLAIAQEAVAAVTAQKRHRRGAGWSIPAAAKELGINDHTLRRAVERGEVACIQFGGLRRIPPAELARLRELFVTDLPSKGT
jgi:excisionase family DNA binding protein